MTVKYRTQADLEAFRQANRDIGVHCAKVASMAGGSALLMMRNPLNETSPALGSAALRLVAEELQAMGNLFEHHAVQWLGESRRADESIAAYMKRISKLDFPETQKRNGIVVVKAIS
jgi:hypothetical protein